MFKVVAGRRRKYVPKERSKEEEDADNERGENLHLPRSPTKRAGSDQPSGDTTLDSQKQNLLGADSPGATATAANSPVAQSGAGVSPTSTLLDRPEASPAARGCVREARHGVVFIFCVSEGGFRILSCLA